MRENISQKFVKCLMRLSFNDIPSDAIDNAKKSILDTFATALAGSKQSGVNELFELFQEWGGSSQSTVIGRDIKLPSPLAAQLNATMAHALDYDDTHESAVIHPGVIVVPTCFAMAEYINNTNGKELLTAMILGTEVLCRMSLALTPNVSRMEAGWHFTSLYGYFAAAFIAGKLLKLTEEQMLNALGIAYHQSAGNIQCVHDGALTKRMGPGFAVHGGILAALLAKKGITGASSFLEGKYGIYNLYHHGEYDPSILFDDLGKKYAQQSISIKPYPCCRGIHNFIDAALQLKNQYQIYSDNIKNIKIFAGSGCYHALCMPLEVKTHPRNSVDSQFSVPWAVATTLLKGKPVINDFSESAIHNSTTLQLTQKIQVILDHHLEIPHKIEAGKIEIQTLDGKTYIKQVNNALGGLENSLSFSQCRQKFTECLNVSGKTISRDNLEKIMNMIENIDQLNHPVKIMELIC